MRCKLFIFAGCSLLTLGPACAASAAEPTAQINGIGPLGKVEKLHTDFQFTEGPAADAHGNVYFTDIPANKIYKVDLDDKLSTFTDESNHANGLMFNAAGDLVACEMDGQLAVWDVETGKRKVLVPKHDGKRFNAPNDLVIDRAGGIYFTDPHFRAPMPLPQGKMGVYYAKPDTATAKGSVKRLIDDLPAPNGVMLSPDEKTLYVFPSGQAEMMAYDVLGPGKLSEGRTFFTLKQPDGKEGTGADGVTIDVKGNLYITSQLGLQVVSPQGKLLGIIKVPEKPANVAFGGAYNKTLYITARTSLYTVPMAIEGHRFAAPKK